MEPVIAASKYRLKAEEDLRQAKLNAMRSLNAYARMYREQGYSGGAERAQALTHMPISIRKLLDIDTCDA